MSKTHHPCEIYASLYLYERKSSFDTLHAAVTLLVERNALEFAAVKLCHLFSVEEVLASVTFPVAHRRVQRPQIRSRLTRKSEEGKGYYINKSLHYFLNLMQHQLSIES